MACLREALHIENADHMLGRTKNGAIIHSFLSQGSQTQLKLQNHKKSSLVSLFYFYGYFSKHAFAVYMLWP